MGNEVQSIAEIRAIIHSLRMGGFCQVDQDALPYINSLIKELPEPEELTKFQDSPEALERIRNAIGYILAQLDNYSGKDVDYKARYEAKRNGLPTRYKVLDWKAVQQRAASSSKQYVIASSEMDELGDSYKSEKLLRMSEKLCEIKSYADKACMIKDSSNNSEKNIMGFRELIKDYRLMVCDYYGER